MMIENVDQRPKDYGVICAPVPPRPRGLHLRRQVRRAGLSWRRAGVGARDRGAGGGGRGRAQGAGRQRRDPRRPGAGRPPPCRSRALGLGGDVEQPPSGVRTPRPQEFGRLTWTRCARPAPPPAQSSKWWPRGVPAGWGAPIYGKLDAELAGALMSINAVKGVEIGEGFAAAAISGEANADEMRMGEDGPIFGSNHAGRGAGRASPPVSRSSPASP